MAIVEAIAASEGVGITELGYSLHDYIDPDVLALLATGPSRDWHLRFDVADHTVAVDGDGTITVDGDAYSWRLD